VTVMTRNVLYRECRIQPGGRCSLPLTFDATGVFYKGYHERRLRKGPRAGNCQRGVMLAAGAKAQLRQASQPHTTARGTWRSWGCATGSPPVHAQRGMPSPGLRSRTLILPNRRPPV
jgi:hypothetical protein